MTTVPGLTPAGSLQEPSLIKAIPGMVSLPMSVNVVLVRKIGFSRVLVATVVQLFVASSYAFPSVDSKIV